MDTSEVASGSGQQGGRKKLEGLLSLWCRQLTVVSLWDADENTAVTGLFRAKGITGAGGKVEVPTGGLYLSY